jgi:hypothetical protein
MPRARFSVYLPKKPDPRRFTISHVVCRLGLPVRRKLLMAAGDTFVT